MTAVAHRAAVKALLGASPHAAYLNGQVPDEPEFPYFVLFMDPGNNDATKLCADNDEATFRFLVTCVGINDDSASIVVDNTRSLLLGVRPVVAGRVCNRIRQETTIPIRPDRDVTLPASNRHPVFATDGYVFESRPA